MNKTIQFTKEEEKQTLGTCYRDACDFARDHMKEKPLLVHGSIILPNEAEVLNGTNKPKNTQLDHAWVEIGDKLFDPANPEVDLTVKRFYKYFQVDKNKVRKFDTIKTLRHMLDTGHYGPWDE